MGSGLTMLLSPGSGPSNQMDPDPTPCLDTANQMKTFSTSLFSLMTLLSASLLASDSSPNSYPRWEGGRSTNLQDPRWAIRRSRDKEDPYWTHKIEIEFYGKIVDENNRPIEGASLKFSVSDLSADGATKLARQSNANGLVSLTGVLGSGLTAAAEKPGYYASHLNPVSFYYSKFWEEDFYQPSASAPVIFHLHKKGEAEPQWHREQEVSFSSGKTEVQLPTGRQVRFELLKNRRGAGQANPAEWSLNVGVADGGTQVTAEEYPFAAPSAGYQASLTLDEHTSKPAGWQPYEGGVLYIKTGGTYGRMKIEMIPGKDWMRVETWINPSGSQNLEFDPAKQSSGI